MNKIEQINWPIPNFNEDPDQNEYNQLFYIDFGLSVFIKSYGLKEKYHLIIASPNDAYIDSFFNVC